MKPRTSFQVGETVTLFQVTRWQYCKLSVAAILRFAHIRRHLLAVATILAYCVFPRPASDRPQLGFFPVAATPYLFSSKFKPETDKDKAVVAFVKRFAKTAKEEAKLYGQPASVKLAQAIVESDAGRSKLARSNLNYFGEKCFSRTCRKGHCSNFGDDSHKDFFRKFPSAWESWRAHSKKVAKGSRYEVCHKSKTQEQWCDCLKKKGYATAKTYANTLKETIKRYHLKDFDQ